MTKRSLFYLLLIGLVLRLSIGYFQFSGDVKNHLVWGNSFIEKPSGFYSRHFTGFNDPNYPPLAIALFSASNILYNGSIAVIKSINTTLPIFPSFLVPLFESENMKMLYLKLPGILSDLGIAYILFLLAKKFKLSSLLPLLFLFNPAFIYVSTIWGQIEPVTTFFLILSLYLSFADKNKMLSLVVFTLAVLTKQTALWLAPIYLFLWWKEIVPGQLFKGIIFSLLTFFLSYLPFGLFPLEAVKSYLLTLSGSSTLVTDAAWNVWYFIYPGRVEDSVLLGPLSVRALSIILLSLFLIAILFWLFKKYSHPRFFIALFSWSLLVFFFQTRVHERHLYFALLFLLLTPGLTKRFFLDYVSLSMYHYLNLYQSLGLPFIK